MTTKYIIENYAVVSKNYKNLSKYDKLDFIKFEQFASKKDRNEIAKYLNAIRKNDTKYICFFESFGQTPRHMVYNKFVFEKHNLKFFVLDNFGWLTNINQELQLKLF